MNAERNKRTEKRRDAGKLAIRSSIQLRVQSKVQLEMGWAGGMERRIERMGRE